MKIRKELDDTFEELIEKWNIKRMGGSIRYDSSYVRIHKKRHKPIAVSVKFPLNTKNPNKSIMIEIVSGKNLTKSIKRS